MVALSGMASASHLDAFEPNQCTSTQGGGQGTQTTCVVVTEQTVETQRSCEVGNSGRQGTQEGTVTTTTTTTTVFPGRSHNPQSTSTQTVTGDFVATGPCKNDPGPQR